MAVKMPETPKDIVEMIMTQHWDMAACRCWVCEAGRRMGCRPQEAYVYRDQMRKLYPEVTVAED